MLSGLKLNALRVIDFYTSFTYGFLTKMKMLVLGIIFLKGKIKDKK